MAKCTVQLLSISRVRTLLRALTAPTFMVQLGFPENHTNYAAPVCQRMCMSAMHSSVVRYLAAQAKTCLIEQRHHERGRGVDGM